MGPIEGRRVAPDTVQVGGVGTGIPPITLKVVRGFFSIIWAALTGKIHSKEMLLTDSTSGKPVTYKTTVYVLKESVREHLRVINRKEPSSRDVRDFIKNVGCRATERSAPLAVEVKRPPGMERRTNVRDLAALDNEYNRLKLCPIDISTFDQDYAPLRKPSWYAGLSSLNSGDDVQTFLLRVYADNRGLFQAGIPAHSLAAEDPDRSKQMAFWAKLEEIHKANTQ